GAEPVGAPRPLAGEQVAAAGLVVPERAAELEALAAVVAHEQAARDRAHEDLPGLAEGDDPQLEQRGVLDRDRLGVRALVALAGGGRGVVARALGVLDLRRVLPGLPAVGRARELGAPVAVTQRGPQRARVRVAGDEVHPRAG